MRYDKLFGIPLILFIVDFALAAPVLVHEERQPYVDVIHIPEDVRTVLRKRVGEKELEESLMAWRNSIESSVTHASESSGSVPQVPDHGPTNVAQAPPPNPALSTANPDVLPDSDFDWDFWQNAESPPRQIPAPPKEIGLAPEHQYPRPSTYSDSSTLGSSDWESWGGEESPPRQSPAPPKEVWLAPQAEYQHPGPPSGSNLWNQRMYLANLLKLAPRPAMPKAGPPYPSLSTKLDSDQLDPNNNAGTSSPNVPPKIYPSSYPGSPSDPKSPSYSLPEHPDSYPGSAPQSNYPPTPKEPDDVIAIVPQASPASTGPDLQLDHPALSTASPPPVNLLDAIYEAKGKAKVLSRASGTARDVGNAAQKELQQPA